MTARVRELYESGMSTREVAQATGLGKSSVARTVRSLGLSRSRSFACSIRRPPKSRHWRTCREMARRIWSRSYGPIPKGHHIHHMDGDFTNNALENLQALSEEDHMKIHRWRKGQ